MWSDFQDLKVVIIIVKVFLYIDITGDRTEPYYVRYFNVQTKNIWIRDLMSDDKFSYISTFV